MNGYTKEGLSRWLPLVIAIIALAVSWGVQKESLSNNEGVLKTHEEILTTHGTRIGELERQSSVIETDLAWIKTTLLRIEERLADE